jgi:hypothetical protein
MNVFSQDEHAFVFKLVEVILSNYYKSIYELLTVMVFDCLLNFFFNSKKSKQYSPFRISNMTSGGGKSNHRKLSLNT